MFSVSRALPDHQAAINSAFDVILINYVPVHVILISDILNQIWKMKYSIVTDIIYGCITWEDCD